MKTSIFTALLISTQMAFAGASIALDPVKVECKKEDRSGQISTNVYHDGILIHEGQSSGNPTMANRDFILCTAVQEEALATNKRIMMLAGNQASWSTENFWTVEGAVVCR